MKKVSLKTAVVYDKWLHSLGGGEVVACSIAKILSENGYKVLFISGKNVSVETILDKLKIDLTGIEFKQVWNDEKALRRLVTNKDLFINISFMDYSKGFAKKNLYYVNFPTKLYNNLRGLLVDKMLLPLVSKLLQPVEALNQIDAPVIIHGSPVYALKSNNKYALSNLKIGKPQQIAFKIYLENFYKHLLENIKIIFDNAKILKTNVEVRHDTNTIKFKIKFIPNSETAYLNLNIGDVGRQNKIEEGKVYLFYPKIYLSKMQNFLFLDIFQRISIRLRAGTFTNVSKRLNSYQSIITYSQFACTWIRRYWKMDSVIVSPPVDLLCEKYNSRSKKNNWICSVGRFFTLGHGKKQEILIEAFKLIYDNKILKPGDLKQDFSAEKQSFSSSRKYANWELHLVGGLGDEPSSLEFFQYLKEKSKGYPIYFHINISRREVEEIYIKSKIYWHATGFGEDKNLNPIRFEHFGIAPIEAISAGCIPILFKGGGLVEIIDMIKLDHKKYIFDSVNSLVELTINQIKNKNSEIKWDEIFEKLRKNYSKEVFKERFLKIIN